MENKDLKKSKTAHEERAAAKAKSWSAKKRQRKLAFSGSVIIIELVCQQKLSKRRRRLGRNRETSLSSPLPPLTSTGTVTSPSPPPLHSTIRHCAYISFLFLHQTTFIASSLYSIPPLPPCSFYHTPTPNCKDRTRVSQRMGKIPRKCNRTPAAQILNQYPMTSLTSFSHDCRCTEFRLSITTPLLHHGHYFH